MKRRTNSHTVRPKTAKVSPDAIRLLNELYRQEKSWSKVAKRLGMTPDKKSVCWQVAKGKMKETAPIRAAVRNARRRERKAFAGYSVKDIDRPIDREQVRLALLDLDRIQRNLKSLLEDHRNAEPDQNPTTD